MPSIKQLVCHISESSSGTLIVENVENIGGHYAKTLRLWREAFTEGFEHRIKPALLVRYPDMPKDGAEVFRRKWEVSRPSFLHYEKCALTTTVLLHIL